MTLTNRGEWLVVALVIAAVTVVLAVAFSVGQDRKADRLREAGLLPAVSITCTEDMACWDCDEMGNGRCGR